MPMDLAIVYKAAPNRLGVLYMVDPKNVPKLQAYDDSPLSADEVFPGC